MWALVIAVNEYHMVLLQPNGITDKMSYVFSILKHNRRIHVHIVA